MIDFTMPSLGADMEAATLMTWKIAPGDSVKRGDVVAEVETDKGLIEIEVFHNGVVEELVAQIGQKLPVGAILARLRETGAPATPAVAPAPSAGPAPPAAPIAPPPATPAAPAQAESASPAPAHPTRVSPLARKVAAALGVDLSTVSGSGPGGAIERADVERAAAAAAATSASPEVAAPAAPAAAAPAPPARGAAMAGMRRAIAAAMAKSNREIPHYYLATRIDMRRALDWLEAENARHPIAERLLPAAVLLAAVARSLKQHPDLNGFWIDNSLVRRDAVHINFAIATRQGGLITPAVLDVHARSVHQIMAALHDLIPRAKDGGLRSSELSEGTITVTSLGDLGVDTVHGVIYPPQVAIVGFGRIRDEAWAENGMLDVRPVLHATLAGDHRATDGRTGARFLDTLDRLLQHPESL
jgi:pyruvate dehydrogenase E2 component (dihydrolipoamide acetyltransferase)